MHAPPDHQVGAGQRGRTSARWRAAAAVTAAAALSLAVATVPASAAGGYTVTATIPDGKDPTGAAVDPVTHTAYVANEEDGTVSVISAARTPTALSASIGLSPHLALTLTATLTAARRPLRGQPVSFGTGHTHLCTQDTSTRGIATCALTAAQARQAALHHCPIQATYPGNASHQPSSATTPPLWWWPGA